ncbi:cholinesterase 1-like [Oppia nitens]|uniref:cholinesterase 1-like n=1 Tax=Oppia nitens TaxID=1686743 RepID=UPI0023DC30A4|nr:cholinesterase 1-like [Oppia nitens]
MWSSTCGQTVIIKLNLIITVLLLSSSLSGVVHCYPRPTDCRTQVVSDNGGHTYLGCRDSVKTTSLSTSSSSSSSSGHKNIYSFKGIPYALPPVGQLRFRKPVPFRYTRPVTIDARQYRKPCIQPFVVDYPFGSMSEDCLYLNVWTPRSRPSSSANLLPVMIWLYGGAFTIGSGSQFGAMYMTSDNIYEGTQLALRDVVVVTLNYRLGIFGFLYGNRTDCPGNQGFWDQSVAIRWVRDNIRTFGGNPDEITLFGESAGSISISNHIVSNVTRHLFKRAIMQSGSAYIKLFSRDTDYSYRIARRFASNRLLFPLSGNCPHDSSWIQCLRRKPAKELLTAQVLSILFNPSKPWYTVWIQQFTPIFGDQYVPISVNRAVKQGDFKKDVHILMGHVEMEGLLFTAAFDIVKGMSGRYLPFVGQPTRITRDLVANDIRQYFFDNDTIGVRIADEFTKTFDPDPDRLDRDGIRSAAVHAFGDYFLTCPTILFGGHIANNRDFRGRVYQYRMTSTHRYSISRNSLWANHTHTDDIALVFGAPFNDHRYWTDDDRRFSRHVMDIWIYFAKYGYVPKIRGNVWPPYSTNRDGMVNATYLELNPDSKRMGTVWVDQYRLNYANNPPIIGDCFYFWKDILDDQF